MKEKDGYRFILYRGEQKIVFKTSHSEQTIDEMVELFKDFLLGIGFHPDNVKAYFPEEGE
ncbi:MAG: hypothetical protein HC836_49775 [Richelia sp. RM2_1_2]|nr:hypothetical protein [Richelia sp. RM2_1_2]